MRFYFLFCETHFPLPLGFFGLFALEPRAVLVATAFFVGFFCGESFLLSSESSEIRTSPSGFLSIIVRFVSVRTCAA